MDSDFDSSVTQWLEELKRGDQQAARNLWNRYFDRLARVARAKLRSAPRRVRDEEDVALSAFDALCEGAAAGRFAQLANRDDLWRLLVAITAKKAVDDLRHEGRKKRGGGQIRSESVFFGHEPAGFDQFLSQEPTPSFLAMLEEDCGRLLECLGDDTLRQVAQCRIEGYANAEIAARLGISLRSVERNLQRIRSLWSEQAGLASVPDETVLEPSLQETSPLAECPLFRAVPQNLLASQFSERRYSPGEKLLAQGEAGTSLLVIAEGEVEISSAAADRSRRWIDRAGRGDVLGEMSLLTNEPRTADAVAIDDVRALVLPADRFHELARQYPELSVLLTELVARRLGKPDRDALTDKVLDHYRITGRLGRGGMGIVYRAEDLTSGRHMALKMMSHKLVYHQEALRRFDREAQIIQSLRHPAIVEMYGRFAAFHTYFLVLEYCPGRTLDEILADKGALAEAEARSILGQLAAALAYAHQAGVVHRDVKPANIMLTDQGRVKLMDFGLAEPVTAAGEMAGRIVGTPRYMAPEQRRGESVGCQADYFSFGCVAYELLAGQPLFAGDTEQELHRDFQSWQPPIYPNLSDEMSQVLATALQADPGDRCLNVVRIADWAAC